MAAWMCTTPERRRRSTTRQGSELRLWNSAGAAVMAAPCCLARLRQRIDSPEQKHIARDAHSQVGRGDAECKSKRVRAQNKARERRRHNRGNLIARIQNSAERAHALARGQ